MLIWFQQWSKMILGVTYMDVTKTENNIKTRQLLTERFTAWAISYRLNKMFLDIDYTGNLWPDAIAITRSFRPTKRIFAYLEHSEYQFTFNKLKN
jgi:outer membrane receptor for ferrienterochelin and colicins